MSFPPPDPNQQPPQGPKPDKMWRGIPVWSFAVGPAIILFWIYETFIK